MIKHFLILTHMSPVKTYPEKKVEEEEKVFDAFIHSHGF